MPAKKRTIHSIAIKEAKPVAASPSATSNPDGQANYFTNSPKTMTPDSLLYGDGAPSQPSTVHIAEWLQSESANQLTRRHDHFMKNREVDMGFNLFHLISEVYHRENLHSDMMEAIMTPSGSHGQGDLFLRLFLAFLNNHPGPKINLEDYQNAKVVREDGRIDLLIYDEKSRKAIIIENKINGAADMDRQLVRYHEKVTDDWNYKCQAIVYLCLNQKKYPATPGWTDEEREKVKPPLLRVICAYDEGPSNDLYNGWLKPCLEALSIDNTSQDTSLREEVIHIIRQYSQLILKLGRTLMNKPIMEDFYQLMLNQAQHDSATAVATMVTDLPKFRAARMKELLILSHEPFAASWIHKETILVLDQFPRDVEFHSRLKIHIEPRPNLTMVYLWDNNGVGDTTGEIPVKVLQAIGASDQFQEIEGWYGRCFLFPGEESNLLEFIHHFLGMLDDYCKQKPCLT